MVRRLVPFSSWSNSAYILLLIRDGVVKTEDDLIGNRYYGKKVGKPAQKAKCVSTSGRCPVGAVRFNLLRHRPTQQSVAKVAHILSIRQSLSGTSAGRYPMSRQPIAPCRKIE
jgi:hypothetical protein